MTEPEYVHELKSRWLRWSLVCRSTRRLFSGASGRAPGTGRAASGGRYSSMTDIDKMEKSMPNPGQIYWRSGFEGGTGVPPLRERRKVVSFTVELQRENGPLGLTLAATNGEDCEDYSSSGQAPRPEIRISSLLEDGLAQRSKTIQVIHLDGVASTTVDGEGVSDGKR